MMGSIVRRQRREIARKWAMAGISKETAEECVKACRGNREEVRDEATKLATNAINHYCAKLQHQVNNAIIPKVQGDMICLFLYCLHSRWGFGAKRLQDAAADLWEVVGEMQVEQVTGDALAECIKQETGLKLQEVFAKLSNEARRENGKRKKAGK